MNHELQLQRVQRTLDSQQFKSMKMRLLLLTLLMAWGGTAHAAANRTAAQDTHALAALKECVYDGELSQWNYLRSWRPGSDPCNDGWHGVTCASNDSGALRVRGVRLVGLSLHGDLGQWEIADGELSALESLDLSSNVFRGTIPASLSRLRRLNSLSLGVNVLYGTLPPELGELSLLERFDIDGGFNDQQMLVQAWAKNSNYGTPGTSFGNQIAGTIPNSFTKLTKLHTWIMHRNMLTGSLPARLGDMRSLRQVDLSGNYLTGEIPGSIQYLQNLRDVQLDDNFLSGSIPTEIQKCSALEVLVLEGNRLTGALPPHMPPRMAYIDLHDNMLTGTIPAWQWNRDAPRIHVVLLHMNKLSGTVPYALTKRTVRDPLLAPYDFIPIHLDWLLGFQRHYVFRMKYLETVSVAYNAELCGMDPGMPDAPASFLVDECDHPEDKLIWPTGCGLWPEKVGTRLGAPCAGAHRAQAVEGPCGRADQPCSNTSRCCQDGTVCKADGKYGWGRCVSPVSLEAPQCQSTTSPLPLWKQCGGGGYSGAPCCAAGAVCAPLNPQYSLCVPRP